MIEKQLQQQHRLIGKFSMSKKSYFYTWAETIFHGRVYYKSNDDYKTMIILAFVNHL